MHVPQCDFFICFAYSDKMILRTINKFSTLNAQFLINKSRNAVRFESQNLLWDYEESNYQTQAFTKGLASLSFTKNDNVLLRLSPSQQSEAYVAKLGTAGLGVNLILSQAKSESEVDYELKNNNIKAVIFEPTLSLGQQQFIDILNKLIPELAKTKNGQRVQSSKYTSLTSLIQTNFYSFPGVYKFKSILNYAEDKYFKVPTEEQFTPIGLPESQNSLFVTQPASEFGFKAGVLNSNVNGRYLVVVEPKDINRIAQIHENKVDLIATEDIPNLNPSINVFVEKGSSILRAHQRRTEV